MDDNNINNINNNRVYYIIYKYCDFLLGIIRIFVGM